MAIANCNWSLAVGHLAPKGEFLMPQNNGSEGQCVPAPFMPAVGALSSVGCLPPANCHRPALTQRLRGSSPRPSEVREGALDCRRQFACCHDSLRGTCEWRRVGLTYTDIGI